MFENIKALKIILALFVYSVVVTTTYITKVNYSSSSYSEQINQLNAQVNSLKIELKDKEKATKNEAT
jgi:hypothetical protein